MDLIKQPEHSAQLKPTALVFNADIDLKQWSDIGHGLSRIYRSMHWWIGDWAKYGIDKFGRQRALAVDHAEECGIQQELFGDIVWVSQQMPARIEELTWSHHRVLAELGEKEQKQWAQRAVDNKWTVAQLREAIRKEKKEFNEEPSASRQSSNPTRLALDAARWIKSQPTPATWEQEQRDAFYKDWAPIAKAWNEIAEGIA